MEKEARAGYLGKAATDEQATDTSSRSPTAAAASAPTPPPTPPRPLYFGQSGGTSGRGTILRENEKWAAGASG